MSFLLFALGIGAVSVLAYDRAQGRLRYDDGAAVPQRVPLGVEPEDGDDDGGDYLDDDELDERLESDLFAKLLAEGDQGVSPTRSPVLPDSKVNAQVDIADRMLGALEGEDRE